MRRPSTDGHVKKAIKNNVCISPSTSSFIGCKCANTDLVGSQKHLQTRSLFFQHLFAASHVMEVVVVHSIILEKVNSAICLEILDQVVND